MVFKGISCGLSPSPAERNSLHRGRRIGFYLVELYPSDRVREPDQSPTRPQSRAAAGGGRVMTACRDKN